MNMQEATQTLVAAICADYISWGSAGGKVSETRQRMNEEFCDRIKAVEKLIENAWKSNVRVNPLKMETRKIE